MIRERPTRTWCRLLGRVLGVGVALVVLTSTGLSVAQDGAPVPAEVEAEGVPPNGEVSAPAPGAVAAEKEVPLSFANVNVNNLVKWLGEQTGKSVIKHKQVNCQLTVMSSKPLPLRAALDQIYRALALEGVKVIELDDTLIIIPSELEAQLAAELISGSDAEGKRMIRFQAFALRHAKATDLKDKIRVVLSGIAKVEVHEASNRLIVTDYAENLRLLAELIEQIDIATVGDTETRLYPLRFARADQLSRIVSQVLGGTAPSSGEGTPSPGAPVRVVVDEENNRLIVNATEAMHIEAAKLIEELDQERPADVSVRTVPLKHVDAKDLIRDIGPMYERFRGGVLRDRIEISAHSRSNALIVLSSEENYRQLIELVEKLDTEDAKESETRVFTLKNADAEDISAQLEDLFRESNDDWWYWDSRRSDDDDSVKFVANRRQNTVIASGSPEALENVAEMIEVLDQPISEDELAPLIYRLKYVDAFDVEEVLRELFVNRQNRRRSYWDDDWYGYGSRSSSGGGDVGRLQGKVRITSSLYTNTLIITGNSKESLDAVRGILDELDQPAGSDATINIKLRHAKAVTLANNLNILFAQGGAPPRRVTPENQPRGQNPGGQPGGPGTAGFQLEDEVTEDAYFPWLGGNDGNRRGADGRTVSRPVSDLVGKVRIVPDQRTNSLLVTTSAHFFAPVLKVLDELDVPTPQVLIEATIIEVAGDVRDRLGVRWSPDGNLTFDTEDLDGSFIGSAGAEYSESFLANLLGDAMGTGVISASTELDVLVQFLRKTLGGRLRASPRINVADNERGKLFVGSRIPFITGSLNTVEGGRNDSFEYRDVGIILEVTPHINKDGEVTLRISVESSQVREGQTLFGGAIIDTRNYRTEISIESGQTLVLGGIIQREQSEVERKVPILGDIWGLGWLFKKVDTVDREVELMVFLKPTVTKTPEEVRRLMEDERERTPKIQAWSRELEEEAAAEKEERDRAEAERAAEEAEADPSPRPLPTLPTRAASGAASARRSVGVGGSSARRRAP